jgi:integrase
MAAPLVKTKTPGIEIRHSKGCATRKGRLCDCRPTYQAHVYDARSGRRIRKTFPTPSAAKRWRQEASVALRAGTLRAPTSTTLQQAADALIAGMTSQTILDRSGKPYKPSSCRGYEQALKTYALPHFGDRRLGSIERRDVQAFVEHLRGRKLAASTITNILDPLRVIFRRALRDDEILIDPTDGLELPAVRGRRDRIESPESAHELLAALPDGEKAFWAIALFAGLRRGELRALRWTAVDFDAGVICVEASWDPEAGEIEVKSDAGNRAVPMALVVRRELAAHKARTHRDLVFGRTAEEPFFASTLRARANKAWEAAGLEPITPHEARHCAISFFIAAGMDWKQISTWAGHSDVRQTWNRYGHLLPGGHADAASKLDALLEGGKATSVKTVALTVAPDPQNAKTPRLAGSL